MRHFVIADGVIENVIDAPVGFELPGKLLIEADTYPEAGPGWGWAGGAPVEPDPRPPGPPPVITAADVRVERERRLALGFEYDFGDARSVHHIRTSPADMLGWSEVTTMAQALINMGNTTQPITVATGSGAAQVTPIEWQGVLIAAAAFRQPIWGGSFILEGMDPIPADYNTNEAYWGG